MLRPFPAVPCMNTLEYWHKTFSTSIQVHSMEHWLNNCFLELLQYTSLYIAYFFKCVTSFYKCSKSYVSICQLQYFFTLVDKLSSFSFFSRLISLHSVAAFCIFSAWERSLQLSMRKSYKLSK